MNKDIENIFMRKALKLARKAWGQTSPNPMVGAVIVKNNKIIGKGFHKKAGKPHAEVNAINSVSNYSNLNGSIIYVTLEPCSTYGKTPPCTEAIINAGIKKVVIGCLDPNPKHAGAAVRILEENYVEVVVGIEEEKCKRLNEAFFYWVVERKPFVLLKMAMTLDGKIATENGNSQWITGARARRRVQKLRRWADAILVGGNTARLDRPSLTVRNKNNDILENWIQPKKLVASNTMTNTELCELFPGGGVELVKASSKEEWLNTLESLGDEKITSILVEGGGELAADLLRNGLINKVEFHIAPKILSGRNSRPVFGGVNPETLSEAFQLNKIRIKKYGNDISVSGYISQ